MGRHEGQEKPEPGTWLFDAMPEESPRRSRLATACLSVTLAILLVILAVSLYVAVRVVWTW